MAYGAAAPSTAAPNPLKQAMTSIVGADPLSQSTGTSDLISYEGGGARLPASDVIAITGDPGTGATTAETWAHQLALEQQQQHLSEFAWQKAMQEASAKREADMFGYQVQALNLQNQLAQQKYALDQAAENRAALMFNEPREAQARAAAASREYNQFTTGSPYELGPVTPQSTLAYHEYLAAGKPTQGYDSRYNANDPRWKYYDPSRPGGVGNISPGGGISGFGGGGL